MSLSADGVSALLFSRRGKNEAEPNKFNPHRRHRRHRHRRRRHQLQPCKQ